MVEIVREFLSVVVIMCVVFLVIWVWVFFVEVLMCGVVMMCLWCVRVKLVGGFLVKMFSVVFVMCFLFRVLSSVCLLSILL